MFRTASAAPPPTEADVGDADSFGKRVRWLGFVQTGSVILTDDCGPFSNLGPDDRCVQLAAPPAVTNFSFPDLARITLPGDSTVSLICQWATQLISYNLANSSAAPATAEFSTSGTFRIESVVLEDPSLPFNGGIDLSGLPLYRDQQTLAANAAQAHDLQATRTCIGGLVSKSALLDLGLTEAQVKQFFKKPITIRAGIRGTAQGVTSAQVLNAARFTGDRHD